jgi:hypothetical protein
MRSVVSWVSKPHSSYRKKGPGGRKTSTPGDTRIVSRPSLLIVTPPRTGRSTTQQVRDAGASSRMSPPIRTAPTSACGKRMVSNLSSNRAARPIMVSELGA